MLLAITIILFILYIILILISIRRVPRYPHVQTYINDNSTFTDTVATASDDDIRLLCVFTSSKGKDGEIKAFNSTEGKKFIEEYGASDSNICESTKLK